MVQRICERLLVPYNRQKSYTDTRQHDLEFAVADHVYLIFSLTKGVMRFGKSEKLSPWFVGPFEILGGVGPVPYRMHLPP